MSGMAAVKQTRNLFYFTTWHKKVEFFLTCPPVFFYDRNALKGKVACATERIGIVNRTSMLPALHTGLYLRPLVFGKPIFFTLSNILKRLSMNKIVVLLTFIFLCQCAVGQKNLPDDVEKSINQRIEYGHAPGIVVGIIDRDGPRYYTFGTKTIGGQPVNEHTIFEIGSISKTFTSLILADMELKGQLKITDPAQKYLPSTVKLPDWQGHQITLGHLSDHTSGLPRMPSNFAPLDPANPYADYTVEKMYEFLNSYKLPRDVGATFEYSNLAVGLLGHILSLKAGKTYEELVINKIALPLGMKSTKITLDETMKANLAMGHSNGVQVANWDLPTLAGAGAIRSSLHNMLRYVAANLGLQKSELMKAMELTHHVRHDKDSTDTRVGLAWIISGGAEGDIYWHNGGTGGYRTFAGFVKATGTGVVVLTNSDTGADDIGMRLLNSKAKLKQIKKSIVPAFKETLEKQGLAAAMKMVETIKKDKETYEFDEGAINTLGYQYLGLGKKAEALAILKINVDEYPNSFNAYDSYAEALMMDGQKDAAIVNYKKSLELNPANINATEMLAKMGAGKPLKIATVKESILDSYTGEYELAPGFTITITKTANQFFGQATGQEKFELFALSDTEFFLKVVPAKITFFTKDGQVESLTLYQNGNVIPGKKIRL